MDSECTSVWTLIFLDNAHPGIVWVEILFFTCLLMLILINYGDFYASFFFVQLDLWNLILSRQIFLKNVYLINIQFIYLKCPFAFSTQLHVSSRLSSKVTFSLKFLSHFAGKKLRTVTITHENHLNHPLGTIWHTHSWCLETYIKIL